MTPDDALKLAEQALGPRKQSCSDCGTSLHRNPSREMSSIAFCMPCAQASLWRLATFVQDTLGVQMPCGWPEPTIGAPAHTVQMGRSTFSSRPEFVEWNGATMDRFEALGIAAALIRCAAQLPEQE